MMKMMMMILDNGKNPRPLPPPKLMDLCERSDFHGFIHKVSILTADTSETTVHISTQLHDATSQSTMYLL